MKFIITLNLLISLLVPTLAMAEPSEMIEATIQVDTSQNENRDIIELLDPASYYDVDGKIERDPDDGTPIAIDIRIHSTPDPTPNPSEAIRLIFEREQKQKGSSFMRILGGTTLGAVVGGAALGATGLFLGAKTGENEEILPASVIYGALGVIVGIPVGSAIGARQAAVSPSGKKPGIGKMLLSSTLSAAVGGLVWNQIGSRFDSHYSYGASRMTSWYVGASAGVATHLLTTSIVAYRLSRR